MRTLKLPGFNALFLGAALLFPPLLQAQYGVPFAPYTQTANLDNCTSSSVSLNTMAINQFYLYTASGVSVLYTGGVNSPNTGTINLQSTPPANATIVQAYLEVVEDWSGLACSTSPVSFGGSLTAPGTQVGQGNLENKWTDPRYGNDITGGGESNFFCDVRYDVTSLVSPGTPSYNTNSAGTTNLAGVMECLVVVYTVPSPASCGAVALGDGLFVWDGSSPTLEWGLTPWYSTLDWSCQHSTPCAANQFSRWGGASVPDRPISFTDQFFSTTSPAPAQPAFAEYGGGTIFQDASIINDTFLDTYNNVPLSNSSGKITWALGNPLSGQKSFYYVNLLAASCNSVCATLTPTSTPTFTNSATPTASPTSTFTPTITSTPTSSFTFTITNTPTNSPTATPTSTPTNSFTNTDTFTNTFTATSSPTPTATATFTASDTPTNTFTQTPTPTSTNSFTETPTSTPSNSPTQTPTSTPSNTPTPTPTDTNSPTITFTPTNSMTYTASYTATPTASPTPTFTPSFTFTLSYTPTFTNTFTSSFTYTLTPSATATPTATSSFTPTFTFTLTTTPTLTVTRPPTRTPTPTATLVSHCDEFYISHNSFCPSQGPVSLRVAYCDYQGQYSLRVYNSAGEHIRTLDERWMNGSFQADYSWDGTNKYGGACSSGVYVFYLVEPFHKKTKRVLLTR